MIASVLPVYNRLPFTLSHGEGAHLVMEDGKRCLDFTSGIAVNCLGHAHPVLVNALQEQAEKLWHVSNLFNIPGMNQFADALTSHCFADTVFFCNSGAEALECAFKMVRKYHDATGNPDRYRIITFSGAFHGRTLATIWASKRDPMMQEGFGPPVEGFDNVPFGDLAAVEAAITEETGAILVEPIQGDGGIRPCDPSYLAGLRKLADDHGILLVFDEVQCGMGRTGELFAHQGYAIEPDIMTSAKGIGGGFPLGACLASEKAASGMTKGTHGSTYGGNPLAMKVGNAVFSHINRPEFLAHVKEIGGILKQALLDLQQRYPHIIEEVRGKGLILGMKVTPPNKDLTNALALAGLLTAPASDNVIRLLPPLIIEQSHIDEAVAIIESVCKGW